MKRWSGRLAGGVLALALTGCAGLGELLPESRPSTWLPDPVAGEAEAPASPFGFLIEPAPPLVPTAQASADAPARPAASAVAEAAAPAEAGKEPAAGQPPAEPGGGDKTEEFVDPFAQAGEAGGESAEAYDPLEPFNQAMFTFNRKLDEYLLKPVAEAYDKVVWDPLEFGIQNAFHNIRTVPRVLNNLFQGKFEGAAIEVGRLVINSTFGIGGFFDFAGEVFELKTPDEDFGQTLGSYDVKPGPYLVIPFLGPFTLRDGFGFVMDIALDPFNWLILPFVQIHDGPQLVTNDFTSSMANIGARAGDIVNTRSINIDKTFEGFEEVTVNLYGAVRSAYLEKRAKMIRE
jgi:phospholipid-binding lipoprotein MlaA